MMKNIFIISPYFRTGGPRSLHQLANILLDYGYSTKIVYLDWNRRTIIRKEKVIYDDCKANVASSVDDVSENVVIVPETAIDFLQYFHYVKKIIWWLSLDFYFEDDAFYRAEKKIQSAGLPKCLTPIFCALFLLFPVNRKKIKKHEKNKIVRESYNMYNCEYVRIFLTNNNALMNKTRYLCGPINLNYTKFESKIIISNKKELICFNPAKSDKILMHLLARELQKRNRNIQIIALENMSHEKLIETLLSAKIYIDFGTFPGPERIPREAVMCYCNIITSRMGAAGNNIDVPIDNKYKIDISIFGITRIANQIMTFFSDYEKNIAAYDLYRHKVIEQINNFEKDAINNLIYWNI